MQKYSVETTARVDILELRLNIDGLPLFKSSKTCLWPILCSTNLKPTDVFPVAITCGNSKPCDLEFLCDTVKEILKLEKESLWYQGRHIAVQISGIICDAPAKAFVKSIKNFSGYYGCDRCIQKGQWLGHMTFQQVDNLQLRTDMSFRQRQQEEHHNREQETPLCQLNIDMVTGFPIDYMHQAYLGVMKKLVLTWMRGPKETRMSAGHITIISNKIENLRNSIPNVFARRPRGLNEIDRWKATEYRQLMLYTGKIVLKGLLKQELYDNFMCFSTAMCILVQPSLTRKHWQYARDLLKFFVSQCRELYGEGFLVYNVHQLLHIADVANSLRVWMSAVHLHLKTSTKN